MTLARDHPQVMEELVLVLRALQAGQGVALDGLPNKQMREKLGRLLSGSEGIEVVAEGEMMETTYYYRGRDGEGSDGLLRQILGLLDNLVGPRKSAPPTAGEKAAVLPSVHT